MYFKKYFDKFACACTSYIECNINRNVREVIRWMFLGMFKTTGWWTMNVVGTPAGRSEAPILVMAPHSSFFDTLPVILTGVPILVAKAGAKKAPILGSTYCEFNLFSAVFVLHVVFNVSLHFQTKKIIVRKIATVTINEYSYYDFSIILLSQKKGERKKVY